jgi:hypothetical protein
MYTFIPRDTLILLNSSKSRVSSTTLPFPFIEPVKMHEPKKAAKMIADKIIAVFFIA